MAAGDGSNGDVFLITKCAIVCAYVIEFLTKVRTDLASSDEILYFGRTE